MKTKRIAKVVLFTVIVVLCAITTLSAAKVPKKLTITDIPREFNGKFGMAALGQKSDILFMPKAINGNTLTGDLIMAKNLQAFTGKGNYMIIFIITKTNDPKSDTLWQGFIPSKKIDQDVTTISFDDFTAL